MSQTLSPDSWTEQRVTVIPHKAVSSRYNKPRTQL